MTNSRAGNNNPIVKVKNVDTSRTSTSTLAADPELVVPVKASKSYSFMAFLLIDAHATPHFKFDFTAPSGAVGKHTVTAWNAASVQQTQAIATGFTLNTDDTYQIYPVFGTLVVSTTAGDFTLRWAQQTSDANTTILRQGSSLSLYES